MSQTKAELIEPQGNVAFDTNTLYVDASNNRVGIGTTSPSTLLHLRGSLPELRIDADTTNGVFGLKIYNSSTELVNCTYSNVTGENRIGGIQSFVFPTFYSGGSERARITSSGQLLVGTSTARANLFNSTNTSRFQVEGAGVSDPVISVISSSSSGSVPATLVLGKQNSGAVGGNTVVASNDFIGGITFQGNDGSEFVEAASIYALVDGTPGTNDMPGRLVFSTTADGASSPTERMRISSTGTVTIGPSTTNFNSPGVAFNPETAGQAWFVRDNAYVMYVNRLTSDGDLIQFAQASTIEGTISVSGTTVSYNGAHLSRWSQLPSGAERTEILRGTVLSNIDEMCEWGDEDNEQLNRMKVSDVEGDKNVSGVFQAWDDDDDTYTNDFYCAMTGDFIIRIAQGVTVQRGDLLMSAGDGTAKPQDDDIIRSKTVAKVTSTNVSCTYEDGSYCVPCVLMAC